MKTTKPKGRVITLDLLRGYFMIAILLNHLYFYPNGLEWVAVRGDLFVTAAEGFFFISGIVLGIVRGQKLIAEPFAKVAKLLLKRGAVLYITSIILTLIFTLIGWQILSNPGLKAAIISPNTDWWLVLWRTLSFDYVYGWADYLRLYSVFMLASPAAMWLLRKGKWWIVLIASLLIWLLYPANPADLSDTARSTWQIVSWQLIFFGGMIVGFHAKKIELWWRSLSKNLRRSVFWSTIGCAALTLIANILLVGISFDAPQNAIHDHIWQLQHDWYDAFFAKERMPLTRALLFLLWFSAAFMIVRKFEKWFVRHLGWLLLPFGTNSLYAYIISAFVLFFVHLIITPGGVLFNFAISAGCVAVVWLAIRSKFLMRIIPR